MSIKIISSEKAMQENADRLYEQSEDRVSQLAKLLETQDVEWDSERIEDMDERGVERAHLAHSRNELDEILAEAARKDAIARAKEGRS